METTAEYSMTLEQVKLFFRNYGLEVGLDPETVHVNTYNKIVKAARKWHGEKFASYVKDCFMAVSEEYKPGKYRLAYFDFDLFHAI